jgi:hypothetical protein
MTEHSGWLTPGWLASVLRPEFAQQTSRVFGDHASLARSLVVSAHGQVTLARDPCNHAALAANPVLAPDAAHTLSTDAARALLCRRSDLEPALLASLVPWALEHLLEGDGPAPLTRLAGNPSLPTKSQEVLLKAFKTPPRERPGMFTDPSAALALNPSLAPHLLESFITDAPDLLVSRTDLSNEAQLRVVAALRFPYDRRRFAENPSVSPAALTLLASTSGLEALGEFLAKNPQADAELQRALVREHSKALAANPSLVPGLMAELLADPSLHRVLAASPALPRDVLDEFLTDPVLKRCALVNPLLSADEVLMHLGLLPEGEDVPFAPVLANTSDPRVAAAVVERVMCAFPHLMLELISKTSLSPALTHPPALLLASVEGWCTAARAIGPAVLNGGVDEETLERLGVGWVGSLEDLIEAARELSPAAREPSPAAHRPLVRTSAREALSPA